MHTIIEAPFTIDIEEQRAALKIRERAKDQDAFADMVARVLAVGNPKAIYKVAYIQDRDGDTLRIDEVVFKSSALCKNLEPVNRVFPYIATCGTEVDQVAVDPDDFLKVYWLDALKLSLLRSAIQAVTEAVKNHFQLDEISAMNPGSGDVSVWPIQQQRALFSLFGDVEDLIGVRLLPSCLMVPGMSVSGIFFQTETSYQNCQLCQRANCPGRRAPFDPALWAAVNA